MCHNDIFYETPTTIALRAFISGIYKKFYFITLKIILSFTIL